MENETMMSDANIPPTVTPETLGRAIAAARVQRGWTQAQLAERIGLTQSRITDMETGKLDKRLSRYAAAAVALGRPLSELVADAEGQGRGER
jgi:transcriptional regulator with XRE-family HTH domain